MRTAVLAVVLMAGCAKPQPVEVPAVVIAPQPVVVAAVPRVAEGGVPSNVPQDPYNLAQLERARKGSWGESRDLASGKFNYGGKLDDFLAAHKPDVVFRHDDYTTVVYSGARGHYLRSLDHTYVIAKNGRMVRAFGGGCVWHPVFFDGMTEAERKTWSEGFQKSHKGYAEADYRNRLRASAGMTVAGPVAALAHLCEP